MEGIVDSRIAEFDRLWKARERDGARALAEAFVVEHREALAPLLENKTREDLVDMVSAYRQQGAEQDRIIVDMWLLVNYEPQRIQGAIHDLPDPRAVTKNMGRKDSRRD